MTLDERIEMAVSGWLDTTEFVGDAGFARESIEKLLRKAAYTLFPELFAETPTHWLAPMEATPEMLIAGWPYFGALSNTPNGAREGSARDYRFMRNAYLKGQS